jgi:hypothetical protein
MAVLVIADVPGQTREGFAGIAESLDSALKQAPGFIMVTGFPVDGSWQTLEVWETAKDAAQFYAKFVRPNLPPNLKPKRTVYELHTLITKEARLPQLVASNN